MANLKKDDFIYWLGVLTQLIEQDRLRADDVEGKTLTEAVEMAQGEWERAQGEVDKLKGVE